MRHGFLDDEIIQFFQHRVAFLRVRFLDGGVDLPVKLLVAVPGSVPGLIGAEALAQDLDRVAGAVVHQIAAGLGLAAHVGAEGTILHGLDVHFHTDLLVVSLQHGRHIHVVGAAGADLQIEAEAFWITGFGQQFFRFLRIVLEQFTGFGGELIQRGVEFGPALREGVVEQFALTVEQRGENGFLVHRDVQGAAHAYIIEGFLIGAQGDVSAIGGKVFAELELRRGFLQLIHQLPADRLHDIDAAGTERRHRARLILDDVIDHFIVQRQRVFLAVEGHRIPIVVVLRVHLLTTGLDFFDAIRPGAGGITPVRAFLFAEILPLRRRDAVVVSPGNPVRPVAVELVEISDHGVVIRRFPALDEIPEGGDGAGTLATALERSDDVVGHQLPLFHHAGHFLPLDALAQVEDHPHGVFLHLPAFRQAAFQLVVGNIGLLDERIFVLATRAVLQIAAQQGFQLQIVVVAFPGPVLQIPGSGIQSAVHGGDIHGAAELGSCFLGGLDSTGGAERGQNQSGSKSAQSHAMFLACSWYEGSE